jgi:hypothetical protein
MAQQKLSRRAPGADRLPRQWLVRLLNGGPQDLSIKYDFISADCHIDLIWLPPDLFTANASEGLKDRMPYVIEGHLAGFPGIHPARIGPPATCDAP